MAYVDEIIADSPIAYYRLDETSGTVIGDSSGNSRTGTYASGTLAQPGLVPSDNVSTSVLNLVGVVNDAAWMNTAALTVKCRVRINTLPPGGSGYALVGRYGTGAFNWLLWVNTSSQLAFQCRNDLGTVYNVADPAVASTGVTYEVAGTYDGATMRLFVNGTQVGSTPVTNPLSQAPRAITLGRYSDSAATDLPGYLDEIALYGQALTSTRLSAHYASSQPVNTSTAQYSFVNMGYAPVADTVNTTMLSYQNIGILPVADTRETTLLAYENIGAAAAAAQSVIRPAQGWGIMTNSGETVTLLTNEASGTSAAYENIV